MKCTPQRLAYAKAYRRKNLARVKAYQKIYRRRNRGRLLGYHKRWSAANAERMVTYKRDWYLRNRRRILKARKLDYKKHSWRWIKRTAAIREANKRAWPRTFKYRHNGFSLEDRAAMIKQQRDRCACCRVLFSVGPASPHADHDHATDQIRGILCHNCNRGLGYFKDSVKRLALAIAYLKRTNTKAKVRVGRLAQPLREEVHRKLGRA